MVGRFGLSDISPSSAPPTPGEFPARAVVGEPIPVSATVFREGHDAVGGERRAARRRRARRLGRSGCAPGAPGTDRWHADVVADRPGAVVLRRRGVERPDGDLAPRRHRQDRRRPGRRGPRQRPRDRRAAVRPAGQDAAARPSARAPSAAAKALRDTDARRRAPRRAGARRVPAARWRTTTRCASWSTESPRYPLWVDRPARAVRLLVRVLPALDRRRARRRPDRAGPSGPARHVQGRRRAPRLRRSTGLRRRLPAADPPDRRGEPQGPEQHAASRAELGRRLAVGDRLDATAATTPIHPELGTMADFTRVRGARQGARHGGRAGPRAAVRARPSVGRRRTRSGSPRGRTARIAYAENPPKKYQDIYPLNFDNDPNGLYAESCASCGTGSTPGVTIFRVDNPHTKPINFWQWLIAEVRKTDPDVLFLAEAFTRPAMMHELARIGFHQSYTYFTWRNTKDELEQYAQELVDVGALHAAELLRQHAGHPARVPADRRTRRRSRSAPCWPPRCRRRWGVYSGYELYEHLPVRPGSEEYLDSEKYQLRPRDFAGALADGRSLAPLLARAEPDPPRAPGAAPAAQPALPPRRQRRPHRVQQARRGHRRHDPRGLHRQPARMVSEATVYARPGRARRRLGPVSSRSATCSSGAEYRVG